MGYDFEKVSDEIFDFWGFINPYLPEDENWKVFETSWSVEDMKSILKEVRHLNDIILNTDFSQHCSGDLFLNTRYLEKAIEQNNIDAGHAALRALWQIYHITRIICQTMMANIA